MHLERALIQLFFSIQLLKQAVNGTDVKGSFILLVSDGENTNPPSLEDVEQRVYDSGVQIISLAFTENSDQGMVALASATGGQSYFISGKAGSTALVDAFTQMAENDNSVDEKLSQVPCLIVHVFGKFFLSRVLQVKCFEVKNKTACTVQMIKTLSY